MDKRPTKPGRIHILDHGGIYPLCGTKGVIDAVAMLKAGHATCENCIAKLRKRAVGHLPK